MTTTEILSQTGALITNSHIVYTGGTHGSVYFNKDAIYAHPHAISELCNQIAKHFKNESIDAVLAPALGGIILTQLVASRLSELTGTEVLAAYAEKTTDGKDFVIKRGYDGIIQNKRVLVVEDVLNTGGSVRRVVELCKPYQSTVVGLGVLCNYDPIPTLMQTTGVPQIYSLYSFAGKRWDETECPLCKSDVPINTTIGKSRDFLARKVTINL